MNLWSLSALVSNCKQSRFLAACLTLSLAACAGESASTDEDFAPGDDEVATSAHELLQIATISASANDGNLPQNAVDGDLDTRWSANGVGAYLTIDLGATTTVQGINIAWYRGKARRSKFTIAASTDKRVYRTVYTGTSSGTQDGLESYDFPDVRARALRITVNGNSENTWASVSELEVLGNPPAPSTPSTPTNPAALFSDAFAGADGLITNEYAYWNPTRAGILTSANWEMNSGSLFRQGNTGWSGVPDGSGPNITSSNANDSAVYRMMSKRADFKDVAVSFRLKNNNLVTTSRTPAVDWDGVHVFMRYQSEESLYYATVNRRDGVVLIKKKVPGGPSNGGTYYTLSGSANRAIPFGAWQDIKVTAQNNANGSVTLRVSIGGTELVSATDSGTGGPPITAAGKTGLRGDNCNFNFDDFTVTAL